MKKKAGKSNVSKTIVSGGEVNNLYKLIKDFQNQNQRYLIKTSENSGVRETPRIINLANTNH